MRIVLRPLIVALAISSLLFFSCSKEENYQSEPLESFMPLAVGKSITYRLDSTVFTNFNRVTEIHKYQLKDSIQAELTDNLGRPAFRVYRYLRDSAGTQSWNPIGTYFITPLPDQVEVIESNLRVIKLHLPIKNGFSWSGNRYLPFDPYDALNPNNSYDNGMGEWEFYYDGDMEPVVSLQGRTYTDVVTVQEVDESYNVPILDTHSYASRNYSVEKYSKGIGLIYREYVLWEQQPNPTGVPPNQTYDPFRLGFGIKMWMISHN